MQEFDEEIGTTMSGTEQLSYLPEGCILVLTALGKGPGPLPRPDVSGPPVWTTVACGLLLHSIFRSVHFFPGDRAANGCAPKAAHSDTALGPDRQASPTIRLLFLGFTA